MSIERMITDRSNIDILIDVIGASSNLIGACYNTLNSSIDRNSEQVLDAILNIELVLRELKGILKRPSFEEMVNKTVELFKQSPERDQEEFITTEFDNLVIFHRTLGEVIRNYFKLWNYPWKKHIVEGVDMSEDNPDNLSMKVIEEVWRRLKND